MADKKVTSLSDLGKLGYGSGGGKNPPPPPKGNRPRFSTLVERRQRAGRAPYNFVPLDDQPWPAVEAPVSHAWYAPGTYTGHIEIEMQALTDFYTRGMWAHDESGGKESKEQTEPFSVDGKLRLPGSSIRGMIRGLVEILGKAPLDPVNNDQLFFRAVAAVDNPSNMRSFEPQAVAYKARIVRGEGRTAQLSVKVGYLYGGRDGWTIKPAKSGPGSRQWYRFTTDQTWKRQPVTFQSDDQWATIGPSGRLGMLVCSGPIPKKRRQWIIEAEAAATEPIAIPKIDVEAYLEGGVTRDLLARQFDFSNKSAGVPCFYVEWKDNEGGKHISFGHTPYFRMPYRTTTQMAIPSENSRKNREGEWDLAQAIFGRVAPEKAGPDVRSWKGRVAVEDGLLVSAPTPPVSPREISVVLNGPKPTTFQHYLVQTSEAVADSIHWDGNRSGDPKVNATLRGHKLYWHRPGAPVREATPDQRENVATTLRPAKSGATFRCRIRFQNLRELELGVLLAALELPQGCGHRFGMAKPLGFGSFQVSVRSVATITPLVRYGSFFSTASTIETGATMADQAGLNQWRRVHAKWYLKRDVADPAELWEDRRLKELKALLTFAALPQNWNGITRYLEFGQIPGYGNYNEYLQVGYAEKQSPILEKRRPLPPAGQVLEAGASIPKDDRPPFSAERRGGPQGGQQKSGHRS